MKRYNQHWIKRENKKAMNKDNNNRVRDRNQKFYQTGDWLKLSAYVRSNFPICQKCNVEPATEVHHLISINDNWSLRLAVDNLESRCRTCHQQDTNLEVKERKKRITKNKIEDKMNELNDFD